MWRAVRHYVASAPGPAEGADQHSHDKIDATNHAKDLFARLAIELRRARLSIIAQ
jgi:hypothetical protein